MSKGKTLSFTWDMLCFFSLSLHQCLYICISLCVCGQILVSTLMSQPCKIQSQSCAVEIKMNSSKIAMGQTILCGPDPYSSVIFYPIFPHLFYFVLFYRLFFHLVQECWIEYSLVSVVLVINWYRIVLTNSFWFYVKKKIQYQLNK